MITSTNLRQAAHLHPPTHSTYSAFSRSQPIASFVSLLEALAKSAVFRNAGANEGGLPARGSDLSRFNTPLVRFTPQFCFKVAESIH